MGAQFKKFNNKIYFIMAHERENENAFLKLIKTEFAQLIAQRLASLFHFFRNIKNYEPPFSIPFFRLFYSNILPYLYSTILLRSQKYGHTTTYYYYIVFIVFRLFLLFFRRRFQFFEIFFSVASARGDEAADDYVFFKAAQFIFLSFNRGVGQNAHRLHKGSRRKKTLRGQRHIGNTHHQLDGFCRKPAGFSNF